MSLTPEEQLAEIEGELKANLAKPRADTVAFLNDTLKRLRWVPLNIHPARRAVCLMDIAQQFYVHGQNLFSAVEPAALAVMLARDVDDVSLLRRALNLQGIVLGSTNNSGDAIRCLSEALDCAESLSDEAAKCSVWINLGNAFFEAALYADARDCYARAAKTVVASAAVRGMRAIALANTAMCCLQTQQFDNGLDMIRDAVALLASPNGAADVVARVIAEGTYTRLLLAAGRVPEAQERAQIAKEFAAQSRSVRAEISAACSEGLVEVYLGHEDVGLSRGIAALEKARVVKPALRETLLSLVQAYEQAGRHDRALSMHRELTLHIRRAQHDNILRHQELHIQRLELNEHDAYPEGLLESKDDELQRKLAEQTAGAKQGDLLEQMAFTAEMRDDPSGEHVYRVAKLVALLARECGQDESYCETIELAARLHDIGKVAIPDSVMQKSTPLTDGERAIVQTHAATGADLLAKSKVSYADMAEEVARHHHERWDGSGYPEGISGSAIPMAARMVAICDVYDSLTHEKNYRRAWTSEDALREILEQSDSQFDPALVTLFVPLVRRLHGEHDNLDAYLGAAAATSSITLARRRIAESLARPLESASSAKVAPRVAGDNKLAAIKPGA